MKKCCLYAFAAFCLLTFPANILLADAPKLTLNQLFRDNAVLQRDVKHPVWGTAAPGAALKIVFRGEEFATEADKDGKWEIFLPPQKAGGPFDLTVTCGNEEVSGKNILVGDVWLVSGQSNADYPLEKFKDGNEWLKDSDYPNIRFIKQTWQPPHMRKADQWQICSPDTANKFSALGFFFAKALQKQQNVPVGIIVAAADGTIITRWISREALEQVPGAKESILNPYDLVVEKRKTYDEETARRKSLSAEEAAALPELTPPPYPAKMFETNFEEEIKPLIPFPVRGVIWYQGESNAMFSQGYQYRFNLTEMIKDWRKQWGNEKMPFLVVEIPRYKQTYVWADLRDSQKFAADSMDNVYLVTILELGELDDIHPPRKQETAERILLMARKQIYGEPDLVASGPVYKNMRIDGDSIILTFDSVGDGLISIDGKELREFTIAGKDQKFYPAEAVIKGDTVVVRAPQVKEPAAVRYAWRDTVDVNFFNRNGLSCGQFRTDDWKIPTQH